MPSKKTTRKTTPKASKAAVAKPRAVKKAQSAAAKKAQSAAAKKTQSAAAAATPAPVESAVAAQQETIETVMKTSSQAAAKGYEQAVALAQEQVEKAQQTLFTRYDEAASFGKDNVDACVQSGTLFAKGFESFSKELMTLAQNTAEANVATAQALFGAKTLQEVIDLQTEFSRSRFDSLMADSAKLTELGITLAHETIEPIQARLNATVEKLMKPIAA